LDFFRSSFFRSLAIHFCFANQADSLAKLSVFIKEKMMTLWLEWFRCIRLLRHACSRHRTFLWMALVLAAMAIRSDLFGVTSFVRASFLNPLCYDLLLNFFHSNALNLSRLLDLWVKLALRLFNPVTEEGFVLFAADGLKFMAGASKSRSRSNRPSTPWAPISTTSG
jgi:hypothetical protein